MKDGDSTAASIAVPGGAEGWRAIASGLAKLRLADAAGGGLRMDYDFAGGAGFVVARREIAVDVPESWDLVMRVRGRAPANILEIKLVDPAGTSVWRWQREHFSAGEDWTELVAHGRDFAFAWGPAGGGSLARTGALEIAVVAGPGGEGFVEFGDLRIVDRSAVRGARVSATSTATGFDASRLLDAAPAVSWRSEKGKSPVTVTIDFETAAEVGGLVLAWESDARARAFRVMIDGDDAASCAQYDAPVAGASTSFVSLRSVAARRIHIEAAPADEARGVGLARVEVKPLAWSTSDTEFLTRVALRSRRGAWPRYLVREQTLWTPVASPSGGPVGLLNDDGAVEVGEGGFLLEPSLLFGDGDRAERVTWADVERTASLVEAPLPVARVGWKHGPIAMEVTAWATDSRRVLVRYRVSKADASVAASDLRLAVALRPLQATPPWQAWRGLGGLSPIETLRWAGDAVTVNESVTVRAVDATARFGATVFDEGGGAAFLAQGTLPPRDAANDAAGRCEGVLLFDLHLDGSDPVDVTIEATLGAPESPQTENDRTDLDSILGRWREALAGHRVTGGASAVFDDATTAVGHILSCRDGAALQPGPRRYTRSWIRDGTIMAAALLRWGRAGAADDFVAWYSRFVSDDGFVPCCVDRDGVDPLVEHDSHGQFLHAVAELQRFGGAGGDVVRRLWPLCSKVATRIATLREERRSERYRGGPRRAAFGLLPESVSHEGYLAQPVHSYWDDFWALRGLRDASWLAGVAGDAEGQKRWKEEAADLAAAISTSIRVVMEERSLATVPASVEWADFDPTATAGAVALTGAADLFPAMALHHTFDEYLRGFRTRCLPGADWNNYSPYEVRIVGALVRLGRRDDANEVLDALLGGRLPAAWKQWPEIVWRDPKAPAHLGDLPHCWIGAEFAIALRAMLVYEREEDGALLIGSGLRREWIDTGLEARGLATWFGSLDLSIRRGPGGRPRVTVGGSAKPPGGFVVDLGEDADLVESSRGA